MFKCKMHDVEYPEGGACYGRQVPNGKNKDKCCGDPLPSAADLDVVSTDPRYGFVKA